MKKTRIMLVATGVSIALMSFTAYAGQWRQDAIGMWWQNDDGSYPAGKWEWIDSNGDGVSESYYFNEAGYVLKDTTTPDGYTVNGNGEWVLNGVVQTKNLSELESQTNTENNTQIEIPVQTGNGTRQNPYNAYLPVVFTYALRYFPEYNYTASIQLLEKMDGGSASRIVQSENMFNEKAGSGERWVLYHFQMSCISSEKEITGSTIISSSDFYNENSTVGLSGIETATFGKNRKNSYSSRIYQGGTDDFWIGLLLDNSISYTTFKVDTGEGEIWFTTK